MIDWNQINNYISEAKTILLTMHENPDGDGLERDSYVSLFEGNG